MGRAETYSKAEIHAEALFLFNQRPSKTPLSDIEAMVTFAHAHPDKIHPELKIPISQRIGLMMLVWMEKIKSSLGTVTN